MLKKIISKLTLLSCTLIAGGLLYGCSGGGAPAGGPAVANPNTQAVLGQPSAVDPANIQADIRGVTINSPPVITFTLLDETGKPLDPNDVTKAGGRVSFTIAQLDANGVYHNYIKAGTAGQPGFDTGGTFATAGNGVYSYTFKTDITDATKTLNGLVFDATRSHTVAAQIQRTADGLGQATNPYFTFRPDGTAITTTRELVAVSNCNNCHEGSLRMHGGGRRDIALCILCHNFGVIDPETGNSIDMKSMIHKIHMGKNLPSNKAINASADPFVNIGPGFSIIGFSSSLNSYKSVGYPEFSADSKINQTPADCVKCHQPGTNLTGQSYGKDAANYLKDPTMDKCLTCHDDYSFDSAVTTITVKNGVVPFTFTALQHTGGNVSDPTRTDSSKCTGCHASGVPGVDEYNNPTSITGAHTIIEKSVTKNTGLKFQIVKVENASAGSRPKVTFKVTQNDGATIAPSATANGFTLKFAYMPTGRIDYTNDGLRPAVISRSGAAPNFVFSISSSATNPTTGALNNGPGQPTSWSVSGSATTSAVAAGLVTDNGDGTFSTIFGVGIPAGLKGTGVIDLDGRRQDIIVNTPHKGNVTNMSVPAPAVLYFFDLTTGLQVTDPTKVRRDVVDTSKCQKCHDALRAHGGSRIVVPDCVVCHNPNATDFRQRLTGNVLSTPITPTADGLREREIDFKSMIHKIHSGEELALKPFIVYGNSQSVNDFAEVRFPGIQGNCLACHIDESTYIMPFKSALLGTTIQRDAAAPINDSTLNTRLGPYASVCMSCHNDPTFQSQHLAPLASEVCINCHGAGATNAVQTVHPIRK